jgi:predicted dehydrogenase
MWSRFNPAYHLIRKEIKAGTIGEPLQVIADFGIDASKLNLARFMEKELGAGGAVDIGPYIVGFALWAFDDEYPEEIVATGHLHERGKNLQLYCAL